jgi:hypothetical protein
MTCIIVASALIFVAWCFIPTVLLWPAVLIVGAWLVIQEIIAPRASALLEGRDNWYAPLYNKITSRRPN